MSQNKIDILLKKAFLAQRSGKTVEAIKHYKVIIKNQSKHGLANHNLGAIALRSGQPDKALNYFKIALESNFNSAQFWYSYIECFIKLGRFVEAESLLQSAKSKGASGEAFDQLQQKISENGTGYREAVDKLLERQLEDLDHTYKAGNLEDALKLSIALCAQYPKSAETHFITADLYAEIKMYDHAIINYRKSIDLNPNLENVSFNLGLILHEQKRLEEAIFSYKQSISIDSNSHEAYHNMGNALFELGEFDEAIYANQKALDIKPDYAIGLNGLAMSLEKSGKIQEAINAYDKAIALRPDLSKLYNNKAGSLVRLKQYEAAIENYKIAIELNPDEIQTWQNLHYPAYMLERTLDNESIFPIFSETKDTDIKTLELDLKYRIYLGSRNAHQCLIDTVNALSQVKQKTITNPNFNKTSDVLSVPLPKKVVALVHFGRSGTGLLHSLIDGHPEVSTMPSIYFAHFFHYLQWKNIISDGWDSLIDRFMSEFEILFDASNTKEIFSPNKTSLTHLGYKEGLTSVGPNRDEILKLDKLSFRNELERLLDGFEKLDAFVFFQLVQEAYDRTINAPKNKTLLFYHIHNPSSYGKLNFVALAPNARWIMMVREPIQSCESWMKIPFEEGDYKACIMRIQQMLDELDNSVYQNQNSIGIRLEDVKKKPQQTIQAMCKWLGIKEAESLYSMTAQGNKWWGDPVSPDFDKDGMEPFGTTSIKRKVGKIFSENDQFILKTLFYPFSVKFEYAKRDLEKFNSDLEIIRPMLDQPFDWEEKLASKKNVSPESFDVFKLFRAKLIDRWSVLNEHRTYPNIISRLQID